MKLAFVTGHRWSGKSTLAKQLEAEGAAWVCLDPIANAAYLAAGGLATFRTMSRGEQGSLYLHAMIDALPSEAPQFIVSDGAVYGWEPLVCAAFVTAVASRYKDAIDVRYFYLDIPETELRQHFDRIRESMIAAEGEEALSTHNLHKFYYSPPPRAGYFERIQNINPVRDFMNDTVSPPSVDERVKAVQMLTTWYQTFDFPTFRVKGVADSPRKWAMLKSAADDFSGKTVLELGCNQGYYSLRCAELGAVATGIDRDPKAIATAQTIKELVLPDAKATFKVAEARDLPDQRPADITICLSVLHHVPLLQTIQDIARVTLKTAYIETLVDLKLPNDKPLLSLSDNPYVQEVLPNPAAFEAVLKRHFRTVTILNPGADRPMARCDR